LLRVSALLVSCIRSPLVHFVAIRKNWRRLALCTDSGTIPELIPGVELLDERVRTTYFKELTLSGRVVYLRGLWKSSRPRREKVLYTIQDTMAMGIMFLFSIVQRISFKSVTILFLPLLFVVNSDMIRPDLSLHDRLVEIRTDAASRIKAAWAVICVIVIGGSLVLKNFAATIYEASEGHLGLAGRALCEYYVPSGIVTIKMWQIASLVNALIFLYMLFVFIPRSLRRTRFEPPERYVPFIKTILYRVDVVAVTLSLYSLVCGITIVVSYVLTHHFPKKVFQWFPIVPT
jgi:hypothetical protein